MQPIISAMVATRERTRFFLGRVSLGARLRTSWKMAVSMVASAPMIAAMMVSERPIPGDPYDKRRAADECIPGVSSRSADAAPNGHWVTLRGRGASGGAEIALEEFSRGVRDTD